MESEEKKESIKVVDKRRFDESGSAREGVADNQASRGGSSQQIVGSADQAASSTDGVAQQTQATPPPLGQQGDPLADPQAGGDPQQAATLDFSSFVMGLATQTLIMLGEVPDPTSGLVSINLGGARQTIDAIAILEEKTKGNLDENESQLVTEALAGLRMAYVSKVKEEA